MSTAAALRLCDEARSHIAAGKAKTWERRYRLGDIGPVANDEGATALMRGGVLVPLIERSGELHPHVDLVPRIKREDVELPILTGVLPVYEVGEHAYLATRDLYDLDRHGFPDWDWELAIKQG